MLLPHAGKARLDLLHLGPGLSNGLANLHNAKKASSGIVNIVGEQVTTHIRFNAPLTADIEGLARPVSGWLRTAPDAASIAPLAAEAIAAARGPAAAIATLVLPGDAAWTEASFTPAKASTRQAKPVAGSTIEQAARLLASGEPTLIILAGAALKGPALDMAGRISPTCLRISIGPAGWNVAFRSTAYESQFPGLPAGTEQTNGRWRMSCKTFLTRFARP